MIPSATTFSATGLASFLLGVSVLGQTPSPLTIGRLSDQLVLSWPSAGLDYGYVVQSRTEWAPGPWLPAENGTEWPFLATRWTNTIPAPHAARFFRVRAVPNAERGRILNWERLETLNRTEVSLLFAIGEIPVVPLYGVEVIRLTYVTLGPWGEPAEASGILALPLGATNALPLLSYQHGTLLQTNEAPSLDVLQRLPGMAFAAAGYAASVPDLLGFGVSPLFPPYHHARSEATAAIDLLRAIRAWAADEAVQLSSQLFLCGYSHGGHSTMAMHRELEAYYSPEFTVTASAPMAGAFDLSGITFEDFLSGRPLPNPYYIPYLLEAFRQIYGWPERLDALLQPVYADALSPLLARRASGSELNAVLPAVITNIFRPGILADLLAQPSHPVRQVLAANDVHAWAPRAPVLLVHCSGDLDVPPANATKAYQSLTTLGASRVDRIDPQPGANHGDCILPAFLAAKEWFEQFLDSGH